VIDNRTFLSPQKERKVGSPTTATQKSSRGSRAHIKTLTESDLKVSVNRPPASKFTTINEKNESRSSQLLTKAETEKFSPYVYAKKQADEKKNKLIAILKKTEVVRSPKAPLAVIPDTTTTTTITPATKSTQAIYSKEQPYYTFILGKGNNDHAIRKVMSKRYWWKEAASSSIIFDFCWFQTNKPINFAQFNGAKGSKKMANHFEFNREIGTKSNLLRNLQAYCERNSLDLFRITPITFILDMYDPYYTTDYQVFLKYFKEFAKNHERNDGEIKEGADLQKSESKPGSNQKQQSPRLSMKHLQVKLPDTYYNGCNLWLLKPTDYNRGRGINLFNKQSTLEHCLKCFQVGDEVPEKSTGLKKIGSSSSPNSSKNLNLVKSHRFVVQKYIEKPMLIDERKFDIRIWVLIDHEMNLYQFKESYLRLSSEPFSLDEAQIEDKYIHLTNNAVQKYSKNYGKHESGNIVSLKEMEKYLPADNPKINMQSIKDRMKELIRISMESVKNRLNASERKQCFEVFGYDFILDSEYNVWIIEVNSNPSIEESNDLLRMLVPRMLDDAFRLTIDKVFTPSSKNCKAADILKNEANKEFPVTGYTKDENLWEYISCLKDRSGAGAGGRK